MSSHAVATSVRGLPDVHSPAEDLHPFGASPWSSHVSPEPSTSMPIDTTTEFPTLPDTDTVHVRSPSWNGLNVQERNEALGNLLAALAPPGAQSNSSKHVGDEQETKEDEQKSTAPAASPDIDAGGVVLNNALNTTEDLPALNLPQDLSSQTNNDLALSNLMRSSFSLQLPPDQMPLQNGEGDTHPPASHAAQHQTVPDRREIEAFAKIEFEDGNYYITTYAVELGRDALAYKAALARAEEEKEINQGQAKSSSGRASRPSDRVRRHADSQVQGSVVSEAGGFGGVDDGMVLRDQQHKDSSGDRAQSSQSSIVKPAEVLINPPPIPFDYHKTAERQAQMEMDEEQPAPVTAEHLPKTDTCPLIPIHATTNTTKTEVDTHKGISRRHVKIQWDWDRECFTMRVLGRNGAFLDEAYLPQGSVKGLDHGSKIQISDVSMTFRLPRQRTDPPVEDSDTGESESSRTDRSTSPTGSADGDDTTASPKEKRTRTKITLLTGQKAPTPTSEQTVGPDGQPTAPRKRGPGRPPKDGIMSTRERREREKAQKLADAKAANGGQTPPPAPKNKIIKPPVPEEPPTIVEIKPPEKRKYKKRKRVGEDGEVLPSIEAEEVDLPSEPEKPPVKKARASKSPSPEYPPVDTLTEEQLARPSEPYARLIYDILIEIHPTALPLKQIYRALKRKYPFFVYRVDSEGWQSSVRHNLNQEWNKLFEKGEKEGKGFAWKAIPGALQPQAERKRAAAQAAAAKPKPQAAPRNQVPPPNPMPPLHWQNSTPFMARNGQPPPPGHPPYFQQFPPAPPTGMSWPPQAPPPPQPGQSPATTATSNATGQGQTPGQTAPPFYPQPGSNRPSFPPSNPPNPAKQPPTIPGRPSTGPPHHPPGPPPPPPPPMPGAGLTSSSSASRNMPCTIDGVMAIKRFENAMYQQVESSQGNVDYWHQIFASVKSRLLHGAPESSMPGGETKEETTIMEHVRNFIERFKNSNFEGFRSHANTSVSRTVSPAVNSPSTAPPPLAQSVTSTPVAQVSTAIPEKIAPVMEKTTSDGARSDVKDDPNLPVEPKETDDKTL